MRSSAENVQREKPPKVKPKREDRQKTSLSAVDCVACPKCENIQPRGDGNIRGETLLKPPNGTKCKGIQVNKQSFFLLLPMDKLLSLSSTSGTPAAFLFGIIYRMGKKSLHCLIHHKQYIAALIFDQFFYLHTTKNEKLFVLKAHFV